MTTYSLSVVLFFALLFAAFLLYSLSEYVEIELNPCLFAAGLPLLFTCHFICFRSYPAVYEARAFQM